jgi:hypothetical protein
MKCDVDLSRQILLCIERRGANCPMEALRADLRHESNERIRYHLQLVIDAGWVAEVARSVAEPAGVRLTHVGHEFVEVARSDARWNKAKAVVIEETGGQSLNVLWALMARWAWRTVAVSGLRPRRRIRRYVEQFVPAWRDRALYPESDGGSDDDQARILRRRRGNRKRRRARFGYRARLAADLYDGLAGERDGSRPKVTLPPDMI